MPSTRLSACVWHRRITSASHAWQCGWLRVTLKDPYGIFILLRSPSVKSLSLCYSLIETNRNTLTEITITARCCRNTNVMWWKGTQHLRIWHHCCSIWHSVTWILYGCFCFALSFFICKSLIMGYRLTK